MFKLVWCNTFSPSNPFYLLLFSIMPSVVWGVVLISIETMNIVICILWCVQWGQLSLSSLWRLIMWIIDLDEFPSCNDLLSQFGILSKGHCPIQWYCCRSTFNFFLGWPTRYYISTNSMKRNKRCKELCGCGQMTIVIFSLN